MQKITKIFQHSFDCDWALGDLNIHFECFTIRALKLDVRHIHLHTKKWDVFIFTAHKIINCFNRRKNNISFQQLYYFWSLKHQNKFVISIRETRYVANRLQIKFAIGSWSCSTFLQYIQQRTIEDNTAQSTQSSSISHI